MEKHYRAIKNGLAQTEQTSLFAVGSDEGLLNACINFVREKGYSVTKPLECSVVGIKKIDDLIGYFYGRLEREHKDDYISVYINEARDRKIAKSFVESRMNSRGLSRSAALQECAEIAKIVLDNYDEYHFKYNINFSIFGSDKLSWVTEKAISIINKKNKDKREYEHRQRLDKMTAEAAKEMAPGYDDLDDLLAQLEEENTDGGKEKGN
jgi:hypothetical protein